jgi:hypothetical protein
MAEIIYFLCIKLFHILIAVVTVPIRSIVMEKKGYYDRQDRRTCWCYDNYRTV